MYTLHTWRKFLATLAVTLSAGGFALLWDVPAVQAQDSSQWVHHLASDQNVQVTALGLSAVGEIFVAGGLRGTVDFDPGPGEHLLSGGPDDVSYIAKYDSAGNFVWAHRLAGNGDVRINDIVVDPMAQIGIVGSFEGEADLDPGPGVLQAVSKGDHDIFLLRLLPDGTLQWGWTAGDEDEDTGIAVTADSRSGLYITGKFEGRIFFESDSPSYDHSSVGGSDVFVARFNNAGRLFWVRVFGGPEDDAPTDIDLDAADNVFLVGTFADEVDLDPLWTSFELRSRGRDDIFVSVLTVVGDYLWSTQLGGTGSDENAQVLVEPDGSFHVSGEFEGSADFDRLGDGGILESRGQRDIFLTRYGPGPARSFHWAFGIGGEQTETLGGIAQDPFGSLYLLGSFAQTVDFDPGAASVELTSSGAADIFLAKYTQQAQLYQAQRMVNPLDDIARAIAINSSSNVLIAGEFRGTIDLGSGLSVSTGQPEGITNAFVAHYARDTWTPLLERAYLPGVISSVAAE
jgi:hypothetical protein